jgi:hypothetical protein|tara:strand:+ start:2184 stop:2597 length:414 start_codon:yes stop_codon:yes gene_type:complete
MAKRKSKRRKSPKTISVLNVLESLTYATIITEGVAGTSVFGLLGDTDLQQSSVYDQGLGTSSMTWTGGSAISLGDIVTEPTQALAIMQGNLSSNWKNMAVASFVTGLTFKWGRALMRRPISNINRNIMKPLGIGIRV